MPKKIMMLGGNLVQKTAILAAKAEGYHVISVDYLPDNPGHKFSDEYYNISTIDKEAILKLAKELSIDGIVSYASDVSAPTAAYVAQALHLPTNPYDSVMIMTHKDLFRNFLKENGFPMPEGSSFTDKDEAFEFFKKIPKPVMVKPIDSSGSKGVNKVNTESEFLSAWDEAIGYSISKQIIVEQYLSRVGYQIDGDAFVIDGKIAFWGICDQHHDLSCSMYAPDGHSFPSIQAMEYQKNAYEQIQKLLTLLNMHMGAYNIEYIVNSDNQVYLLEVGPRNGGNKISDAICAASEIDLARATVRQAVGDDVSELLSKKPKDGFAASYIIHSTKDGIYKGYEIDSKLKPHIVSFELSVTEGENVKKFRNSSCGLGVMVCKFDSSKQMCEMIDNMNDYLHIKVE